MGGLCDQIGTLKKALEADVPYTNMDGGAGC